MPKQVYDEFLRRLRKDILTNYDVNEKYLSVREIAEKFSVSLQTAQKGVKELSEGGLILSRPKIGITVNDRHYRLVGLNNKKIYVISNKQDGHFYSSFYDGVVEVASCYGIKAEFMLNTFSDTESLAFGEHLTELKADGLIMLSFPHSDLPFYHAMREGMDIVSDIILDKLPLLPAVQTDNYKHSFEAGSMLVEEGCRKFYVFGYYQKENKRFKGFADAIGKYGYTAHYVQLSSISGISQAAEVIRNYTSDTGLFISDYSSSYVIDSLCSREELVPKHILAYDGDTDHFIANYLPPIKAVAPSFKTLGEELCRTLIYKWEHGRFKEPLQVKI